MMRFANRMDHLSESNDTHKLDNEIFLMRKLKKFRMKFSNWRTIFNFLPILEMLKENSIVLEVRKNIAIHKESLDVWKINSNN
jgi:hypothetical protein